MTTLRVETHPCASHVSFTDSEMVVSLTDGRKISVPIAWFSALSNAKKSELEDYQLLGDGDGIHWPQLDEDISVKGLLLGFH